MANSDRVGQLSRRRLLSGLSAFGLSLPHCLAARARAADGSRRGFARAKSCIVLWMAGGPPQHETWDPKPDAPAEIRGIFNPIDTSVPGTRVCELMPRVATRVHKLAVLRGVYTNNPSHPSSTYEMLTGTVHPSGKGRDDIAAGSTDWPCLGGVVSRLRGAPAGLPAAVSVPQPIFNVPEWPGQYAGFLGPSCEPWLLKCDPTAENFLVPEFTLAEGVGPERMARRRALAQTQQMRLMAGDGGNERDGYSQYVERAFDLLGEGQARIAFDLGREPPTVRDAYGRTQFGQGCLLARRLVEAGVPLVQVNWFRDSIETNPMWDVHTDMNRLLQNVLMPAMDQGYCALLDDLEQRGLLDETLVVWMGEFGRTPKLEQIKPSEPVGRNHWGDCFSIALAGAGIRGGLVHGASDKSGAYPRDGAVPPDDLTATIFNSLGLPPETEIRDRLNRPHQISQGRVLEELF